MLRELSDRQSRVVVWLHLKPYGDRDFEEHRRMVEVLANEPTRAAGVLAILVVGPGAPGPSAKDRRAIHAALQGIPASARGIAISTNPFTLGAVTAIRWLGLTTFPIYTFSSWEDASRSDHLTESERERFRVAQKLAG